MKVSLLLASADAAAGHALEKLLRDQRYDVEFVHDTQAALKAIDGSQPDALVADLRSARVDGLALLKRARALRPDLTGVLLGDDLLGDWRRRSIEGTARVRAYYDVIPDRESALTLNEAASNQYGDPQLKLTFRDSAESAAVRGHTEDSIKALFQRMARAGNGEIIRTAVDDFQDHPAGGCRMGDDPATSVVDSHGRAHDHENLFVVGAPTSVSGGCANATLTFLAVALRQATVIGQAFPARRST